ncbi:MAG: DUF7948 domain-containing protein, partial [Candidatus Thorarchaeota archaeon]
MMSTSRVAVTLCAALMLLAPLVSTSQLVYNPVGEVQTNNDTDVIQDTSTVLEMFRDDGIEFDDVALPITNQEMQFGGFIQNLGQVPDEFIKYYFSMDGVSVGFTNSKVEFVYVGPDDESVSFSISFAGSNDIAPVGLDKKVHVVNYIFSDIQVSNIPTFDEIMFCNLYDGIDLRYFMTERGLKYEFLVHPGANPSSIIVEVSGSISVLVDDKSVSINLDNQPIFQDTGLDVFQEDKLKVPTKFTTISDKPNSYGFSVGAFDSEQTLIIDPWFLPFSTHVLYGAMGDTLEGIAVDSDGYSYITGHRYVDFWPENRYDLYIGKHAPNGTPIYSTLLFLGDEDITAGTDIEIDSLGNAYICGYTDS